MILVDANLLIYAHVSSMPQHAAALGWFESVLGGDSQVGLPWPSLLAFVRLVSNRRVFERPESIADAWSQVRAWLSCDPVWVPVPTEQHAALLEQLLGQADRPELVPDAHLAALALQHGLTVCSADRDFARFDGVRWENPIAR